jgi:hypothetical protein
MSSRPEEIVVGLVALALVPIIGWRILRGLRTGRLPLYRTYIQRDDGQAKFGVLLVLHALTLLLVAAIAADLLLNLGLKEML